MKKVINLRRVLCALAAVIAAVLLALFAVGCSSPKTFEKEGMKITLTKAFKEQSVANQTVCYASPYIAVTALREEITSTAYDYTLEKYTDLVIQNNKLSSEKLSREGKGYLYFTYERSVDGRDFFYIATTHKIDGAFWLIQFGCDAGMKSKFENKMFGYADSIEFVPQANL